MGQTIGDSSGLDLPHGVADEGVLPQVEPAPLGGAGLLGDMAVHAQPDDEPRLSVQASEEGEQNAVSHVAQRSRPAVKWVPVPPGDSVLAREALPSRHRMIQQLGEPKGDLKVGSLTLLRRSSGYKAVLDALDRYHQAVDACANGSSAGNGGGTLHAVTRALSDLEDAMQAYCAGNTRRSRKADMQQWLEQVRLESQQLINVVQEGRQPPLTQAQHIDLLAFRRVQGDLTWEQVSSLKSRGYSAPSYKAMLELMHGPDPLSPQEVQAGLALGYYATTCSAYHSARLPIGEKTRCGATFCEPPAGQLMETAKGSVNQVIRVKARLQDGSVLDGFFKPETAVLVDEPQAMVDAGIDPQLHRSAARSVATARLDKLLGLGLVPPTEFMLKDGVLGTVMGVAAGTSVAVTGKIRMALPGALAAQLRAHDDLLQDYLKSQGFSEGKLEGDVLVVMNDDVKTESDEHGDPILVKTEGKGRVAYDFADPVLRRELTKLQWLDALCGQVDRHQHNYFIDRGPDGRVRRVTAIDNDLSFGAALVSAHATSNLGKALQDEKIPAADYDWHVVRGVFHGAMLPQVVDAETRSALMRLTPEVLGVELEGLLLPPEIEAAQSRLAGIQAHLVALPADQVIGDDVDWATARVSGLLGVRDVVVFNPESDNTREGRARAALPVLQTTAASYVARDTYFLEERRTSLVDAGARRRLLDLASLSALGAAA